MNSNPVRPRSSQPNLPFFLHTATTGLLSASMKRTLLYPLASVLIATAAAPLAAAEAEEGFTALSDGQTFSGWKMAEENHNTWKIEDGAFVAPR